MQKQAMISNPWLLVKNGREVKFRPPFESMAEMIDYCAQKQPKQAAIEFVDVDNNNRWKCGWGELKRLVWGAAGMLRRKGLNAGDTISFGYHNHPNILVLSLGAWVSGIRTAPLDLKRDDEEMMKYKLELSGAKAVFREKGTLGFGEDSCIIFSGDARQRSSNPAFGILKTRSLKVRPIRWFDFKSSLDVTGSLFPGKNIPSSLPLIPLSTEALVLFTSGTTAKPKGVLLTQENLMANADGIADWLDIKSNDRFMILLPLHHINSTTMSLATLLRRVT